MCCAASPIGIGSPSRFPGPIQTPSQIPQCKGNGEERGLSAPLTAALCVAAVSRQRPPTR